MGVGQFIGNAGFLTFESAKFCNQYIRPFFNLPAQNHGIVTIESKFSFQTRLFKESFFKMKLKFY